MGQLLNLDHLDTAKWNFNEIGWPKPEKSKLEKGWFGSEENTSTLRVGKKQGVAEPFCLSLGHFLGLSWLLYLIWKRDIWAICWLKDFEFFQSNSYISGIFLSRAGLIQVSSTIWAVTLSLLIADRATIPHLKGDNEGFHMRYSSMIWYKRLQSDRQIVRLSDNALVNLSFRVGLRNSISEIIMKLRNK